MRKSIFKIIIILSLVFIIKDIYSLINNELYNKEVINSYYNYNNHRFNEIIIYIPSINLKRVVKKANNDFSNLNDNLVYYNNINYNKKIIIFGHSGMGYGTFFNRIDELKKNDTLYLYNDIYKITYKVDKKIIVNKEDISILKDEDSPILLLITCKKNDKNRRIVIKLYQESVQTLKK